MGNFIDGVSNFFQGLAYFCDATGTWIVLTLILAAVILAGEYFPDLKKTTEPKPEKFSWENVNKGRLASVSVFSIVISAVLAKIILFVLSIILAVCAGLVYFFSGLIFIFIFLIVAGGIVIII